MLLDRDGVTGDGNAAKKAENELMSDPETLKAFIDYCVANYPAETYDLILWDHGFGPMNSFATDQHNEAETITLDEPIDVFGDDGQPVVALAALAMIALASAGAAAARRRDPNV